MIYAFSRAFMLPGTKRTLEEYLAQPVEPTTLSINEAWGRLLRDQAPDPSTSTSSVECMPMVASHLRTPGKLIESQWLSSFETPLEFRVKRDPLSQLLLQSEDIPGTDELFRVEDCEQQDRLDELDWDLGTDLDLTGRFPGLVGEDSGDDGGSCRVESPIKSPLTRNPSPTEIEQVPQMKMPMTGFMTASRKAIPPPSAESMARAQSILGEEGSTEIASSATTESHPVADKKHTPFKTPITPSGITPQFGGFSLASKKALPPPSAAAMEKALSLFGPEETARATPPDPKQSARKVTPLFKHSMPLPSADKPAPIKNTPYRTPLLNKAPMRPHDMSKAKAPEKSKLISLFDLTRPPGRVPLASQRLQFRQECLSIYAPFLGRLPSGFDSPSALKELIRRGALPTVASASWVEHHYGLIVWKLASMVRWGLLKELKEEMIVDQLAMRYEWEQLKCQRSPLRKAIEGDDFVTRRMNLLVVGVQDEGLIVSDGWYCLPAKLDAGLKGVKSIRPGVKLDCVGTQMVGERGQDCLKPEGLHLQLSYNGCRPARWNAPLCQRPPPSLLITSLSRIRPDGGLVPGVDLIIDRRYPDLVRLFSSAAEQPTNRRISLGEYHARLESGEDLEGGRLVIQGKARCSLSGVSVFVSLRDGDPKEGQRWRLTNVKPLARRHGLYLEATQWTRLLLVDSHAEQLPRQPIKATPTLLGHDYDLVGKVLHVSDGHVWVQSWTLICLRGQLPGRLPSGLIAVRDVLLGEVDPRQGFPLGVITERTSWSQRLSLAEAELESALDLSESTLQVSRQLIATLCK